MNKISNFFYTLWSCYILNGHEWMGLWNKDQWCLWCNCERRKVKYIYIVFSILIIGFFIGLLIGRQG